MSVQQKSHFARVSKKNFFMLYCLASVSTLRQVKVSLPTRPDFCSSLPQLLTPSIRPSPALPLLHLANLRRSCFLLLRLCLRSLALCLPIGGCAAADGVCTCPWNRGVKGRWANGVIFSLWSIYHRKKNYRFTSQRLEAGKEIKNQRLIWCDEVDSYYLKAALQLNHWYTVFLCAHYSVSCCHSHGVFLFISWQIMSISVPVHLCYLCLGPKHLLIF